MMQAILALLSLSLVLVSVVQAQHAGSTELHLITDQSTCGESKGEGFENVQIETSDIRLHELLFEQVLHAVAVQRLDHPQTDHLRTYCYRGIVIVIRQDLRTPRPTGWVQLNFIVSNVAHVQQELESASQTLNEQERQQVARFRMKPDVMRGKRKVDRLEVYGPEGFLIGFDQPH
jgi:hypothetical protein